METLRSKAQVAIGSRSALIHMATRIFTRDIFMSLTTRTPSLLSKAHVEVRPIIGMRHCYARRNAKKRERCSVSLCPYTSSFSNKTKLNKWPFSSFLYLFLFFFIFLVLFCLCFSLFVFVVSWCHETRATYSMLSQTCKARTKLFGKCVGAGCKTCCGKWNGWSWQREEKSRR